MKIKAALLAIFLFEPIAYANTPDESHGIPERDPQIGYKTPVEALDALRNKPGVKIRIEQGWTIIEDQEPGEPPALWSFTPEGNPAHPSVVKREVIQKDGKISIQMGIICGASKEACDSLVKQFQELNERIKNGLQKQHADAQQ